MTGRTVGRALNARLELQLRNRHPRQYLSKARWLLLQVDGGFMTVSGNLLKLSFVECTERPEMLTLQNELPALYSQS